MPRLEGEDVESYRTRLSMKGGHLQWKRHRRASSTPWPRSDMRRATIEPFSTKTPSGGRFIVFLKGSKQKRHQQSHRHRRGGLEGQGRAAQSPPTARRPGTASRSAPGLHRLRDTPVAERLFAESGPVWLASATFWRERHPGGQRPGLRRGRVPEGGNNRGLGKFYQPCAFVMYEGLASCIEAAGGELRREIYLLCVPRRFAAPGRHMTEGGEADAENTPQRSALRRSGGACRLGRPCSLYAERRTGNGQAVPQARRGGHREDLRLL